MFNEIVVAPPAFPAEASPDAAIGAAAVVFVGFELGIGSDAPFWPVPAPPSALGSGPPVLAAGAVADAGAIGLAGGEFSGALGMVCVATVGAAVTASSRAAKGWAAPAWLAADAAARCADTKDGVALTSDAILGTCGIPAVENEARRYLQPPGQLGRSGKFREFKVLGVVSRKRMRHLLHPAGKFCRRRADAAFVRGGVATVARRMARAYSKG